MTTAHSGLRRQTAPLPVPPFPVRGQTPEAPAAAQPVPAPADPKIMLLVRLGFYFFALSIPFEMPDRTIPIETTTISGLVFLLTTLFNLRGVYRRVPSALLWFGVWMWFFGLSTMYNRSEHAGEVLALGISFVQLLLIMWAGSNVLQDQRAMRGAMLTFAFACFVRALMQVLGIAAHMHAEWTGGYRVTVLGQNPNYSAIILSAGFVAVLNLRWKIIAWAAAGIIGLALIQTGSRGGLMCAAVGALVLLWHGRTIWARLRGVSIGFVAIALLAIAAYRSPMLRVRFEEAVKEHSLAGRERIYPAVVSMISEKPLLGWGPVENQYEIAQRIAEEKLDKRDAHNILLELFSTTGLFGAVPFLIGLWLCFRESWRARKGPWNMFPLALLMAVLVGCISGTWIASKMLWFALAVAVGAGAYVDRNSRSCAV
ncbi:MAG: O-antigen ligase family protein [Gemmatimonadales bacterium]